MTGDWTPKQANTGIAGTVQNVLVATVNVGTLQAQSPSFTWMPYVSATGQYDINLLTPGCDNFQDCALRTSVQVTVFPGGNQDPWVTTVSQTNTDDANTLIYRGTVVPTSPDFVATITMTLATNPEGSGQGGKYEMVADRVQFLLTSAGVNGTTGSGNGTSAGAQTGFGLFEWPLSSSTKVNATSALPNTTETALDVASFDLYQGLGASTAAGSSGSAVDTVVQLSSGTVYLGGTFSLSAGPANGAQNIVTFQNGALAGLTGKGLNGHVSSLVVVGTKLFVGGSFTDTVAGSGTTLGGVAIYDTQQNQWSALGGGVNGQVTSLGYFDGQVQVTGNFTQIFQASGADALSAGGFAAWDVQQNTWANSGGFLVGSVSLVVNGTISQGEAQSQFVAGNLKSSLRYGASGFVTLATGDNSDGLPDVTTSDGSLSPVKSQTTLQKRETLINFSRLLKRQSTGVATVPLDPSVDSPAVLAGAFWTNSSSSDEVAIIGGNFSLSTSEGLAVYDFKTDTIAPLPGASVNGTVRALLVQGDELYIGGEFTIAGASANGFAVYNLASQQWDMSSVQPLASSSSSVIVRSITASNSQSGMVFVAGSFDKAGSLSCGSICSLNTNSKQWNTLGGGISGDVSDVLYAGVGFNLLSLEKSRFDYYFQDNQNILVASGSVGLSGNSGAGIATFSFSNNTWVGLGAQGDLPGLVTAVEVNNGNVSSIFAAGKSTDGTTSFLSFWNGASWTPLREL